MEATNRLIEAVREYKAGKKEAFNTLYEESKKYVYACIAKVMDGNDNEQDAIHDIMQDTYVEISRNISQQGEEEKFLSWAGKIATRKCYAYLKKNKKYVLLNEEDNTLEELSDSDEIIPEAVIQDKEKQRLLREIIEKQLTPMQKLCIIGYYYNEQKQSEIAKALGIPENTVKTNLSRAKAKIKEGVLDLEKNKGTKLYSVAPLLLLLFTEEVQAAVVPAKVSADVVSAVSNTVTATAEAVSTSAVTTTTGTAATGLKGFVGKIAAASLKAKLVAGIAAVATVASVVVAVLSGVGTSWEEEYKKYLLSGRDDITFDLNDFDEDGEPELVLNTFGGEIVVCGREDLKEYKGEHIILAAEQEAGVIYKFGYGMESNEILVIRDRELNINGHTAKIKTPHIYRYEDGVMEEAECLVVGFYAPEGTDIFEWDYSKYNLLEDESENIEKNEGLKFIHETEEEINEIGFTRVDESSIDERIAEFKENGNRKRKRHIILSDYYEENETEEDENSGDDEETEDEELTEEVVEKEFDDGFWKTDEAEENYMILVRFITATKRGENLAGQKIEASDKLGWGLIASLAADNFFDAGYPLDKYLPEKEATGVYSSAFDEVNIAKYIKEVFGIDSTYTDEDCRNDKTGYFCFAEAEYANVDLCEVDSTKRDQNISDYTPADYTVEGVITLGDYSDVDRTEVVYGTSYKYTMCLKRNVESPFGFRFESIEYEAVEK